MPSIQTTFLMVPWTGKNYEKITLKMIVATRSFTQLCDILYIGIDICIGILHNGYSYILTLSPYHVSPYRKPFERPQISSLISLTITKGVEDNISDRVLHGACAH